MSNIFVCGWEPGWEKGSQWVTCPFRFGEMWPCRWGFGRAMGTLVAPPTLGSETLAALSRTTGTDLIPPSMVLGRPSHVASGARRGQNSLGLFVLPQLAWSVIEITRRLRSGILETLACPLVTTALSFLCEAAALFLSGSPQGSLCLPRTGQRKSHTPAPSNKSRAFSVTTGN